MEKSHTCVEGGAHLIISVWHLLMNLKNNYSLKNWWSEPKKCKNFNNNVFSKKIEKHTWRCDFAHVYLKSWWYDLQFLRIRVWQTKIGNYGSAFALLIPSTPSPALLTTQKIRILKEWKNCWRYHFIHVYQKPQSYEVRFLR